MKVRELMSSPVHTCRPDDSLETAARLLWEHDCGMLPVVTADGRIAAAITDRDICMGAYTRGRVLGQLRVAESMSRDVVVCRPDDEVAEAARRMAEHQVHRLPVVDQHGNVCGLLSLNDLATASPQHPPLGREALKVLVAACRARTSVPAVVAKPAPSTTTAPTAVAVS